MTASMISSRSDSLVITDCSDRQGLVHRGGFFAYGQQHRVGQIVADDGGDHAQSIEFGHP